MAAFGRIYRDTLSGALDAARANVALRAAEGALKVIELRLRFGRGK